jgi:RHS repeat-associated protein
VPTDKQFTGQRLDGTGLYYYGARYYDPTIGRFISADTIVQNPADPQSLNRYSYVFNNPLKYVDPSGNIVDFVVNGMSLMTLLSDPIFPMYADAFFSSTAGQEAMALLGAWGKLSEAAPELTGYIEQASQTIAYRFASLPEYQKGDLILAGDYRDTGNMIAEMNYNLMGGDPRSLAGSMGHEGFHAAVNIESQMYYIPPWPYNSIANESFAYSLEHAVGLELGTRIRGAPYALQDINPWYAQCYSPERLKLARSQLPYPQGEIRRPWPDMGQSRFLTVAQSVWPWQPHPDLR